MEEFRFRFLRNIGSLQSFLVGQDEEYFSKRVIFGFFTFLVVSSNILICGEDEIVFSSPIFIVRYSGKREVNLLNDFYNYYE